MLRRNTLAIAVALATPIAGFAQQPAKDILGSAERAAVGIARQSDASGSRRSRGRTRAGLVMIAVGGALATAIQRTTRCSGRPPDHPWTCTSETQWYKPLSYPGIGIAVTGVLLATVWSDVPANARLDLAVTPDRIQVGKTFGF